MQVWAIVIEQRKDQRFLRARKGQAAFEMCNMWSMCPQREQFCSFYCSKLYWKPGLVFDAVQISQFIFGSQFLYTFCIRKKDSVHLRHSLEYVIALNEVRCKKGILLFIELIETFLNLKRKKPSLKLYSVLLRSIPKLLHSLVKALKYSFSIHVILFPSLVFFCAKVLQSILGNAKLANESKTCTIFVNTNVRLKKIVS